MWFRLDEVSKEINCSFSWNLKFRGQISTATLLRVTQKMSSFEKLSSISILGEPSMKSSVIHLEQQNWLKKLVPADGKWRQKPRINDFWWIQWNQFSATMKEPNGNMPQNQNENMMNYPDDHRNSEHVCIHFNRQKKEWRKTKIPTPRHDNCSRLHRFLF